MTESITPSFYVKFICLLLLAVSSSCLAAKSEVLLLQSNENRFFKETIESLVSNTDDKFNFTKTVLAKVRDDPSNLSKFDTIITLGHTAAQWVNQNASTTRTFYSYITRFQYNNLKKLPSHTAIVLEQPVRNYIHFIKKLLPTKSVGILISEHNALDAETIKNISQDESIKIIQRKLEADENLITILRDLLQRIDVLLCLPDSVVYNRNSLKGILLTTYRQQKPVITYSPSHVKSGALAAIFQSPENIGKQIASLLLKIASNNQEKLQAIYFANTFNIAINQQVAKSLDIRLVDKEIIQESLSNQQ